MMVTGIWWRRLVSRGLLTSLGDQRAYDAWGVIRQGAASGDPKGRYCANLGHVEDDESGLTYMRDRYCEASAGRFVREDSARDGINWFTYARNVPTMGVDPNGTDFVSQSRFDLWIRLIGVYSRADKQAWGILLVGLVAWQAEVAIGGFVDITGPNSPLDYWETIQKEKFIVQAGITLGASASNGWGLASSSPSGKAVAVAGAYALRLEITMWLFNDIVVDIGS